MLRHIFLRGRFLYYHYRIWLDVYPRAPIGGQLSRYQELNFPLPFTSIDILVLIYP